MNAFRIAVEDKDHAALIALFAHDATMHSPVAFRPFAGREAIAQVLGAVVEVLEDFEYVGEAEGGELTVLRFRAKISGETEVEGVDLITIGGDGLISDLTVMMRPLSALAAMGKAMAPRVEGAAKA